jgi:nitroreductase
MSQTSTAPFDLAETNRLLTTTRAVRKRFDLDRPVEPGVLLDCVRIAQQAPTGSNLQSWHWVFVTDPAAKLRLAELYRSVAAEYFPADTSAYQGRASRILGSARFLAENLERVPVLAIPCIRWQLSEAPTQEELSAVFGSIFPAVWSFQLALRARGLGSCITTFHLRHVRESAELLGLPDDVLQVALLPIGYTSGTTFRAASRPPAETIVSWNTWSGPESPPR